MILSCFSFNEIFISYTPFPSLGGMLHADFAMAHAVYSKWAAKFHSQEVPDRNFYTSICIMPDAYRIHNQELVNIVIHEAAE